MKADIFVICKMRIESPFFHNKLEAGNLGMLDETGILLYNCKKRPDSALCMRSSVLLARRAHNGRT